MYQGKSKMRKKTNHTFHLVMTLITCGMWGFVWVGMVLWNKFVAPRDVVRHY